MKAKLIFDLPEDKDDFTAASKGMDYFLALFDMAHYLMATVRGKNTVIDEAKGKYAVADRIQEKFYKILDFYQINMDEIS